MKVRGRDHNVRLCKAGTILYDGARQELHA